MADIDELPRVKIGELENRPVYKGDESTGNLGNFYQELFDLPKIGKVYANILTAEFKTRSNFIEQLKNDNVKIKPALITILKDHFLKGGN
jgi:hypothetical protein